MRSCSRLLSFGILIGILAVALVPLVVLYWIGSVLLNRS